MWGTGGAFGLRPYQWRRLALGSVLLAILASGIALVVVDGDEAGAGEDIFFEGKGELGPDPFTTIALSPCPDGYQEPQDGSLDECVPTGSTSTGAVGSSSTTALYGGSGNQRVCDPEALIRFLRDNPAKARAWVDALNADPTMRWSGGDQLTVDDIPEYIRELTPAFLTEDTRVTNHGFRDGKATPRQSVLQKGTAVLIDRDGVARTRCACGNPLTRPHDVDDPHYRGECWEGCREQPYCSGRGCAATTTTTSSSSSTTSTTTCQSIGLVAGQSGCQPPPGNTTSTTRKRAPGPTTTKATTPAPTTTTTQPTTTTTQPTTTTTQPSNQTTSSTAFKP